MEGLGGGRLFDHRVKAVLVATEAPMETHSAVIFDLFGTLVPPYRHHHVLTEMAAVLGVDSGRFISAFVLETREERETGKVTLAENLRNICDSLGHAATRAQIADAVNVRRRFTQAALVPRCDALQILADLKAMGLRVGLITDCCEAVADLWDATSLAPHIDAAILSVRVGVRKPEQRIYDLVCEALSVEPPACLYVGDGGSHELTGAARAGMDAVLLRIESEVDLDPYRPDAEAWTGTVIGSLSELVDLVSAGGHPRNR
jgi:putative hydrolase of the HAD superfamily